MAYVQSQRFDRFRYAASVQVPLAIAAMVRVGCLGAAGLFTVRLLALSALGVLGAVGGAWLGLHAPKRLPDKAVRTIVLSMPFLLGVRDLLP